MKRKRPLIWLTLVVIVLVCGVIAHFANSWNRYKIGMTLSDTQSLMRVPKEIKETEAVYSTYPPTGAEAETVCAFIVVVPEDGIILYFNYNKHLIRKRIWFMR